MTCFPPKTFAFLCVLCGFKIDPPPRFEAIAYPVVVLGKDFQIDNFRFTAEPAVNG